MGRFDIHIDTLQYAGSERTILHNIHTSLSFDEISIIAGKSGCGKTTLLRMLKKQLQPHVQMCGTIHFIENQTTTTIEDMDDAYAASHIGYVSQQPDAQLVSDMVWHEIAFGLENIGLAPSLIHQRVAEITSFLGLEAILHTPISTLSGGQKQMINLASVLVMRPKVLLLDEPTSQLDPIAKEQFYDLLLRIHHYYQIGIILVEHQLEPLLPQVDHVLYLQDGTIQYDGDAQHLCACNIQESALLPFPARFIKDHIPACTSNPRNEKELLPYLKNMKIQNNKTHQLDTDDVLWCEHVYFRYQKNEEEILHDFSLALKEHEILCLLGGNGSGKTTFLRLLASKKITKFGHADIQRRLLYLPQDPRCLFTKDSLREEYMQFTNTEELYDIMEKMHMEKILLDMHPYDISGGELQRAALVLLCLQVKEEHVIFLLDEPSKGLDMFYRELLAQTLQDIAKQHSILMVSHDVEFASLCSHRCGFLFDGNIAALKPTNDFFLDNYFYTTYWRRCTSTFPNPAIRYGDIL